MSIQEMHIYINNAMQRVGTTIMRRFLPEEIDMYINEAIVNFITSNATKLKAVDGLGFHSSRLTASNLDTVVLSKQIPAYIRSITDALVIYEMALPADYMHLIGAVSHTKLNCTGKPKIGSTQITGKRLAVIEVPKSEKSAGPFYTNVQFNIGDTDVIAGKYPSYINSKKKDMIMSVINGIKTEIVGKPVSFLYDGQKYSCEVYYERFGSFYYKDKFIVILDENIPQGVTVSSNIDGSIYNAEITEYTVREASPLQRITPCDVQIEDFNQKNIPVISYNMADLSELLTSEYAKPSRFSYIGHTQESSLLIYAPNRDYVRDITLSYVKKPETVNHVAGYSCDLPEQTHIHICTNTVEKLKSLI